MAAFATVSEEANAAKTKAHDLHAAARKFLDETDMDYDEVQNLFGVCPL
jgi:hypothetical protein